MRLYFTITASCTAARYFHFFEHFTFLSSYWYYFPRRCHFYLMRRWFLGTVDNISFSICTGLFPVARYLTSNDSAPGTPPHAFTRVAARLHATEHLIRAAKRQSLPKCLRRRALLYPLAILISLSAYFMKTLLSPIQLQQWGYDYTLHFIAFHCFYISSFSILRAIKSMCKHEYDFGEFLSRQLLSRDASDMRTN